MIISEEDVTVTTNAGIWTTNGNTTTVPWDVASTTMYMASPIRDSTYNPPRWNFPHPETREPVTRENLYDWIIQAAVDGKIKRCDHEEHYTKIQCPACQGVGWVLK
jgi:hypothetical protein